MDRLGRLPDLLVSTGLAGPRPPAFTISSAAAVLMHVFVTVLASDPFRQRIIRAEAEARVGRDRPEERIGILPREPEGAMSRTPVGISHMFDHCERLTGTRAQHYSQDVTRARSVLMELPAVRVDGSG